MACSVLSWNFYKRPIFFQHSHGFYWYLVGEEKLIESLYTNNTAILSSRLDTGELVCSCKFVRNDRNRFWAELLAFGGLFSFSPELYILLAFVEKVTIVTNNNFGLDVQYVEHE